MRLAGHILESALHDHPVLAGLAGTPELRSPLLSATPSPMDGDRLTVSDLLHQPPAIGSLDGAVLHVGFNASLGALADVAASARERLSGELFALTDKRVARAIRHAASRGVQTKLLVDPEMQRIGRFLPRVVAHPGIDLVPFGAEPAKLHVKALVADGQHAVVTTAAPIKETRQDHSLELAFEFNGAAARALDDLTRATATGDDNLIRQAADAAARQGIVINDASHGIHLLNQPGRGHDRECP